MSTEPRTELDVSICTVLAFVDLDLDRLAEFLRKDRDRVKRAVDGLVRSGHVIHSPSDAFAFRNSGHWNPDAGEDGELSGPGSPPRRHDDYRDPTSPFYEQPDDWQREQELTEL
jgi:hypothetical protein